MTTATPFAKWERYVLAILGGLALIYLILLFLPIFQTPACPGARPQTNELQSLFMGAEQASAGTGWVSFSVAVFLLLIDISSRLKLPRWLKITILCLAFVGFIAFIASIVITARAYGALLCQA